MSLCKQYEHIMATLYKMSALGESRPFPRYTVRCIELHHLRSARVPTTEPPSLEYEPSLKEQRLAVGSSWTVRVRASGIPRPSLQWYRGEQLLTTSDRLEVRTESDWTEVTITGLVRDDSAPYKLVATNDVRTVTEEFTLRVLGE